MKCPIGCSPALDSGASVLKWTLGSLTALGGVLLLWKWRQISLSGVPLDFALRRAVSGNFLEGHIGLQRAYLTPPQNPT